MENPDAHKIKRGWLLDLVVWVFSGTKAYVVLGLLTVVIAFYGIENWRGRRAWQQCKRAIEARGESMDWAAHIPAPVPDAQNVFKAPHMAQWFVGRGANELNRQLDMQGLGQFLRQRQSTALAKVTVVPPGTTIPAGDADLVLRYDAPLLTLDAAGEDLGSFPKGNDPIIPLIVLQDVPLTDAIKNLARQSDLNYSLGTNTGLPQPGSAKKASQPSITLRWENVTARQALEAVLQNHNLRLIKDGSKPGAFLISKVDSSRADAELDAQTTKALKELLASRFSPSKAGATVLKTPQEFLLTTRPFQATEPARIFVRAEKELSRRKAAGLFPADLIHPELPSGTGLQVEQADTNTFQVGLGSPGWCTASDYLAWSDGASGYFDDLREALKRPLARMDGDYSVPCAMPIPNFVSLRVVGQTLAQRAQANLLLSKPQAALEELTLLNDLCRVLESGPDSQPMTLVAAMIHVALRGVYTSVIADGLRLKCWPEPQLAVLQQQLARINLGSDVHRAFALERMGLCSTLESAKLNQSSLSGKVPQNFVDRINDPTWWFYNVAPRGWTYQNMSTVASLEGDLLDGMAADGSLVHPQKLDRCMVHMEKTVGSITPYNVIAAIAVPNFTRAFQHCARNQTLVKEAFVACALERYRLAHGAYPESLAKLSPGFVRGIPRDIITGAELHYRTAPDGSYVLYSVGWNEKDDGGTVCRDKSGRVEIAKGDWVWQQSFD